MDKLLVVYYVLFSLMMTSYMMTHIFIKLDYQITIFIFLGLTGSLMLSLYTLKFFVNKLQ